MAHDITQEAIRTVAGSNPDTLKFIGGMIVGILSVDKVAHWSRWFWQRKNGNGKLDTELRGQIYKIAELQRDTVKTLERMERNNETAHRDLLLKK